MKQFSPQAKIATGFGIVMAAAGFLAITALVLLNRIETNLQHQLAASDIEENARVAIESSFASSQWYIIAVGFVGTLVSIGAMFGVARSLTGFLGGIVESLENSSILVKESADQMANSSMLLADGASDQASSLHETSHSLEEMTSITERNARNAAEVKRLSGDARQATDDGAKDVAAMGEAVEAIESSSSEVSEIIKTIDEIAFQTNILALNAAVEAARAGESGAGFAVVADEVRNLAQRSAKAANETTNKIQNALEKTRLGVQLSGKVMQSLESIVEVNRQVDTLAAEVADASASQSAGIVQLRSAVSKMDRVTKSNASSAEESASATLELKSQANVVRAAVDDLKSLLSKGSRRAASKRSQSTNTPWGRNSSEEDASNNHRLEAFVDSF